MSLWLLSPHNHVDCWSRPLFVSCFVFGYFLDIILFINFYLIYSILLVLFIYFFIILILFYFSYYCDFFFIIAGVLVIIRCLLFRLSLLRYFCYARVRSYPKCVCGVRVPPPSSSSSFFGFPLFADLSVNITPSCAVKVHDSQEFFRLKFYRHSFRVFGFPFLVFIALVLFSCISRNFILRSSCASQGPICYVFL